MRARSDTATSSVAAGLSVTWVSSWMRMRCLPKGYTVQDAI